MESIHQSEVDCDTLQNLTTENTNEMLTEVHRLNKHSYTTWVDMLSKLLQGFKFQYLQLSEV